MPLRSLNCIKPPCCLSIIADVPFRLLFAGFLFLAMLPGEVIRAELLPAIKKGDLTARLESWSNGFPVNTWVNNAGNEFRFGPTDLVAVFPTAR